MKKKFLLNGIIFIGIQEFWVSFIWNLNLVSFLMAVIILEVAFLFIAYILNKNLRRIFENQSRADLVSYITMGLLGLIGIEWIYVGNWTLQPWLQLTMFSTWGGSALFAIIITDENDEIIQFARKFKKWFIIIVGITTILGLLLLFANSELAFILTYLVANTLYPLLNIVYFKYFRLKSSLEFKY